MGTNGVISTQDFPGEPQYVDDDFPTDFPVVAPFLADLDTSGGRGDIHYRHDTSLAVLNQAAGYVQAGFPRTAGSFVPAGVFVATWEDVGAYQELAPGAEPSAQVRHQSSPLGHKNGRRVRRWRRHGASPLHSWRPRGLCLLCRRAEEVWRL